MDETLETTNGGNVSEQQILVPAGYGRSHNISRSQEAITSD